VSQPVYLDYNSSTPVDNRVLDFMLPYFSGKFGNASSSTHSYGWTSAEAVKIAREEVASMLNASEQELIFTSGATEGLNLAIRGVFETYKQKGKHIITVATEHKAVLDTCAALEKQGAEISVLGVNAAGLIDPDELRSIIRKDTILVAVMLVNNETGVIQPIDAIAEIVHSAGSILLSDTTQAGGKINLDLQKQRIDIATVSAHKMYGPKGAAALFIRRKDPRVSLAAQISGGGHERGLRSGTLNVPAIAGLGKACSLATEEMESNRLRISQLRNILETGLNKIKGCQINGSEAERIFNTSSISISGIRADQLIRRMPQIAVAMGSACTSAIPEPSHVLKAMGLSEEEIYASIRISIGKYTSADDIQLALSAIDRAVSELRSNL
jgi:cysteine desulfurase